MPVTWRNIGTVSGAGLIAAANKAGQGIGQGIANVGSAFSDFGDRKIQDETDLAVNALRAAAPEDREGLLQSFADSNISMDNKQIGEAADRIDAKDRLVAGQELDRGLATRRVEVAEGGLKLNEDKLKAEEAETKRVAGLVSQLSGVGGGASGSNRRQVFNMLPPKERNQAIGNETARLDSVVANTQLGGVANTVAARDAFAKDSVLSKDDVDKAFQGKIQASVMQDAFTIVPMEKIQISHRVVNDLNTNFASTGELDSVGRQQIDGLQKDIESLDRYGVNLHKQLDDTLGVANVNRLIKEYSDTVGLSDLKKSLSTARANAYGLSKKKSDRITKRLEAGAKTVQGHNQKFDEFSLTSGNKAKLSGVDPQHLKNLVNGIIENNPEFVGYEGLLYKAMGDIGEEAVFGRKLAERGENPWYMIGTATGKDLSDKIVRRAQSDAKKYGGAYNLSTQLAPKAKQKDVDIDTINNLFNTSGR